MKLDKMKSLIHLSVIGLRCYSCMPNDDNPSEILDCMNSTTNFGKMQRCKNSKDGNACMLISTGKYKLQRLLSS